MIEINGYELTPEHFADNSLKLKISENIKKTIKNKATNYITWKYESDEELFTLMCLRDKYSSENMELIMFYLPHARMDRVKNSSDVFTLKTFCKIINSLNFSKVYILDPHSNVGPALLDRLIVYTPLLSISKAVQQTAKESENGMVAFFPDEGACKRYEEMVSCAEKATGSKKRDWVTGKLSNDYVIHEDNIKGKDILIIDDICSYGGTFVRAARALKEKGAKNINLYVTHCENNATKGELFSCGLINKVFTTDSLIHTDELKEKIIYV